MAVLHTTVPYLWRRHLGILRSVLACLGLLLHIVQPVRYGTAISIGLAIYAIYSVFLLARDPVESSVYPASLPALDSAFFLLSAMHPSAEGLWLSTVSYFFLLCVSSLLYEWRMVLAVSLGACAFLAAFRPSSAESLWPAIAIGGSLAVVLALQKGQIEERLSSALKRSVLSRSEAETAREQERLRIAGDFHDGPLQSFISFQMRLEIIRKLMARDPDSAQRELVQLQELGRTQVTELRAFLRQMQPVDVTAHNLGLAIREAVEHFERDSGVTAELLCGDLSHVEEGVALELLQIVREALNNVRKHSKAARVAVVIEHTTEGVEVSLNDDGSGFPFSGSYSLDELEMLRLGPRSIKRRVRTLGGDLVLDSRPSEGAALKIRIPAR